MRRRRPEYFPALPQQCPVLHVPDVQLRKTLRACGALPRNHQGNSAKDRNRVIGAAKETKGAVKEAVGKVTGDAKLRADGRADKAEGKTQNAIGGALDTMRDALKK